MKVVILLNTSWNIYNFRSGIVKKLISLGHEVHTIAPTDDSVEKLKNMGCQCHSIELENSGMNVLNDYKYYNQLIDILTIIKPHIALSYTVKPNIYGSIACNKLNIPIINNVSGLGTTFLWNKVLKSLIQGLYKFAFKSSDHIFFQNMHDRQLFLEEVRIDENKTSILPGSGVDTNHFSPMNKEAKKSKFVFLMISRLLIDKGIEEYCKAAANVISEGHEVVFQLLGKPEEFHKRGYSKQKIDELSSQGIIEYLGTTDDVRPFIGSADCVVLPSYREGTSKTLLEAASMGKAMIATDVPGCNNIVEDDFNGFLCEVRNCESLTETFKKMIYLNEDKLLDFATNSRKRAITEFDEQIVIDRYFQKIEDITSSTLKKSQSKEEVLI